MNSLLLGFTMLAITIGAYTTTLAQDLSGDELSINGFRNPSIGLEYRHQALSVHAGYYPTIISKDSEGESETTSFLRAGLTYWFLPVDGKDIPSSFYASASWLRGLDEERTIDDALLGEVGFRWMVWSGLHLRIGVAALYAEDESVKINPTPGIGYSFNLR